MYPFPPASVTKGRFPMQVKLLFEVLQEMIRLYDRDSKDVYAGSDSFDS